MRDLSERQQTSHIAPFATSDAQNTRQLPTCQLDILQPLLEIFELGDWDHERGLVQTVVGCTCFASDLPTCAKKSWVLDLASTDFLRMGVIHQDKFVNTMANFRWKFQEEVGIWFLWPGPKLGLFFWRLLVSLVRGAVPPYLVGILGLD